MMDHIAIGVADLDRARNFYDRALTPLGIERLYADPDGHNIEAVCYAAD